jgi:hypothetical protein
MSVIWKPQQRAISHGSLMQDCVLDAICSAVPFQQTDVLWHQGRHINQSYLSEFISTKWVTWTWLSQGRVWYRRWPLHCVSSLSVSHKDAGWCFQRLSQTAQLLRAFCFHSMYSLPFEFAKWNGETQEENGLLDSNQDLQKEKHSTLLLGGTRWRSWLRHRATSRKIAGSIPEGVIGIFHWHNPSGRNMALGSTQPLTEMSTRNISLGVKAAGA